MIGAFDVDLVREFFQGLVNHALMTLHIDNLRGDNAHHQAETVFKAFGRALRMAVEADPARRRQHSVDQGFAVMASGRKIAVIDYGMGNLRSVWQALVHVADGREVVVTADPAVVAAAERVVFPGAGRDARLHARARRAACARRCSKRPEQAFLGICIGLQMLFEHSEEGDVPGLGVFAGDVRRFPARKWSVPASAESAAHGLERGAADPAHALWKGIADGARFYFVHSYFVDPVDPLAGRRHRPITASPLPVRWRGIISSPFNATRRKARRRDSPAEELRRWKP
jgi:glutamine amidotransferase